MYKLVSSPPARPASRPMLPVKAIRSFMEMKLSALAKRVELGLVI